MYTKEDFLKRFADTESDVLLDWLARNDLADEARAAIRQILSDRGYMPSDMPVGVSEDMVRAHSLAIREGDCPECRRKGSVVEMRKEYWVWSALVLTRYGTRTRLACRDCGRSYNWKALGLSAVLGWWGFPFGVLITPYKIEANVVELFRKEKPEPSAELSDLVRTRLNAAPRS